MCCCVVSLWQWQPQHPVLQRKRNILIFWYSEYVREYLPYFFRKQQHKRLDRIENVPVLQLWCQSNYSSSIHSRKHFFFFQTIQFWFHGFVSDSVTVAINQAHWAIGSLWSIYCDSDRGVFQSKGFVRFSWTRYTTSDVVLYLASRGRVPFSPLGEWIVKMMRLYKNLN